MIDDEINNEAEFWRELIQLWEIRHEETAPIRMYQALEMAEAKAKLAESINSSKEPMIH